MQRDQVFILAMVFFLGGISCASYLVNPNLVFWLGLCVMIAIAVLYARHLKCLAWTLLSAAFLLGFVRLAVTTMPFSDQHIAYFASMEEQVALRAAISVEPDSRSDFQYLIVESEEIEIDDFRGAVSGKVKIKTDKYPEFEIQDQLRIAGLLQKPKNFEEFNYADFLAKDDVFATMYFPYISKIEKSKVTFWRVFFTFKNAFLGRINSLLPEPSAGIVAGLLLGYRRSIPENVLDDLGKVGLTHILAISGYNITLLINFFALAVSRLPKFWQFLITVVAIVFFTLFTGMSPSVIRASLMGILMVMARFFERKSNVYISLMLSAVLMVLFSPRILNFDLSFQLSFAATLGLIVAMPYFEKIGQNLPALLKDTLLVTLSAQLFTLPLIIGTFSQFSIIAPLANIFVLPLIPLIMATSFALILISYLIPVLTLFAKGVVWFLISLMLWIVDLLAKIPFAMVEVPGLTELFWCFYLALMFILFHKPKLAPNCR